MFAIPVYIGVAWIFLLEASIADRCWMSSYPYHYTACSKWTLFKENDQECTEIVLGGHSTSLFDKRRTQRLESPFLSTNQHKFPVNLREDQTPAVTPENLGGNTQDVNEYSPTTIIDLLQTTRYQTIKHRNYISTITQSSGDHHLVTAIDYTSDADDASTSHSVKESSEFISTNAGDDLSVSVTEYKGSGTNALTHTVDNISNGNNVSITEYPELETSRISTTRQRHSSSDNSTTDYQQLETTGNQQVNTNKTPTTFIYQKLESDATSTSVFQKSSNESMSTTGYQQTDTTWYYEQTSVPTSTISHGDEHVSTDHETSKTSMSTLTTSFNMNANKSTIEKSTTPKVTPALTLEHVFYTTTQSSTVQNSTQVTTTTPISTPTDNLRSTTFESTTSAYCKSTIYKTEDNGAFQLFIESLGGIQNMQFQAKASKGIRVVLLKSLTIGDFVEVKIGGKANDRSEIKSCSMGQCVLKTEVTTPQYLTSEEFRDFRIAYIPDESLSVGRNNEEIPFMEWIGLPLLDIKYAAFSTDDYKAGEFRFCSQNDSGFQEIPSPASAPCPNVINHLSCTCELPPLPAEANVCRCLDRSTDVTCLWLPKDCDQLWQNGIVEDGNYTIYPTRNKGLPFHVYCNMTADEGWTMLQRRVDGSADFYRDYESYKKGFGTLDHEFWLGNEKIFHLSNQNNYTLRIDMVILGGFLAFAEYDAFRINDETDDFRLASLGSFTGSVYDAMALSLDMKFSTFDYDRDVYSGSCASISGGSWWYRGINAWCYDANLNGIYGNQKIRPAIVWYEGTVGTFDYLLTYVDMKIRPNSGRVTQGI